jgi:hypothetical protein
MFNKPIHIILVLTCLGIVVCFIALVIALTQSLARGGRIFIRTGITPIIVGTWVNIAIGIRVSIAPDATRSALISIIIGKLIPGIQTKFI